MRDFGHLISFHQGNLYKGYPLFLVLLFVFVSVSSQTVINGVSFSKLPIDYQLVERDSTDSDRGIVLIEGEVDKSVATYDAIRVTVERDGASYGASPYEFVLDVNADPAPFAFSIKIKSELRNYSFIIEGLTGGSADAITRADNVVAGDVYIIQGQSNAAAKKYSGSTADLNEQGFVRVYANATDSDNDLIADDNWYEGQGDGNENSPGNTGQWGMKLADDLVNAYGFPVAIFNGGDGGKQIGWFLEKSTKRDVIYNNYERLLYRLEKTGLKGAVKAVLWSQGENIGGASKVSDYYRPFEDLRNSWYGDYPNIDKIYIFQTRMVICTTPDRVVYNIEAQRQLANDYPDIAIMSTSGIEQHTDDCHFGYSTGYKLFAERIEPLVDYMFYGGNLDNDDNPPDIVNAYMQSAIQLIIETSATSLNSAGTPNKDYFEIVNGDGATVEAISINGSNIELTLSNYPGNNATLTHLGAPAGEYLNVVENSKGIELLSFLEFPIDGNVQLPTSTTWDGNTWSEGVPNSTVDVVIDGDYDDVASFESKKLKINNNSTLTIGSNSSVNTVTVHGSLSIQGDFNIGDRGSLVMTKDNANISGVIKKQERSTARNDVHDFTYWSSSVEGAEISEVFPGVNPNRIFYYDQSQSAATDPDDPSGTYWNVWQIAAQNEIMQIGWGYASEGVDDGRHSIEFVGTPNNGDIEVPLKGNFGDGNVDNDFNLIGNPYPSAIDMDLFLLENTSLIDDGTVADGIYLWTHDTQVSGSGDFVSTDYASYSLLGGVNPTGGPLPDKNLGSGQGFFVRAADDAAGGSVRFTNEMRLKEANDLFFKGSVTKSKEVPRFRSDISKIWLDLKSDQDGRDQILIGFKNELSKAVDPGYDVPKFKSSSNPVKFYSMSGKDKFAIQGLKTFVSTRRIRMGFEIKESPRNMTVSISRREGEITKSNVYLYDRKLKIQHDLTKSDYEFTQLRSGDFPNRFELRFTDMEDREWESGPSMNFRILKAYNQHLLISASHKLASLTLYDFQGNEIYKLSPQKSEVVIDVSMIRSGSLIIISGVAENGEVVTKKTLISE